MTLTYLELKQLTGKKAVFIRGFMEQAAQMDTPRLRLCQEAGLELIQSKGETMAPNYISATCRLMYSAGVVEKYKLPKSKSYGVRILDKGHDFIEWLADPDNSFGMVVREKDLNDMADRSAMIDYLKDNLAVRIAADHPVPKAAYKLLMERFARGELDMVFAPRSMGVYTNSDTLIEYASVGDSK